jgi:hypothetical protein
MKNTFKKIIDCESDVKQSKILENSEFWVILGR